MMQQSRMICKTYLVPVFWLDAIYPPGLIQLDAFVGGMASKQQIVSGVDSPCKPHEEKAVDAHHCIANTQGRNMMQGAW